MPAEKSYL